jgi:hypothetical protein
VSANLLGQFLQRSSSKGQHFLKTGFSLSVSRTRSEAALLSGPVSVEARVLLELRRRRAKDDQEFAFRVGDYYFVGPMPDARTELALIAVVDEEANERDE